LGTRAPEESETVPDKDAVEANDCERRGVDAHTPTINVNTASDNRASRMVFKTASRITRRQIVETLFLQARREARNLLKRQRGVFLAGLENVDFMVYGKVQYGTVLGMGLFQPFLSTDLFGGTVPALEFSLASG